MHHRPPLFAWLLLIAALATGPSTATAAINVNFNSPGDAGVTSNGYIATGEVEVALHYAPATGSNLTVVNNTALGFISGRFSNLAQGQRVGLPHSGIFYEYVANYYGGTGNDLVLQWAATRAMAWGQNTKGQVGDNSTTPRLIPTNVFSGGVLAGKTITTAASRAFHNLVLCEDGTVAAWGSNATGQLGNNSQTTSLVPMAVDLSGVLAGKTVVAVAAGYAHSLALCADGTVAAWGQNISGQLGNNSQTTSLVPMAVDGSGVLAGKTIVAVAAGSQHSLALCADGTVAAWGDNASGQLGNNSFAYSLLPVAVDLSGVLAGKTVVAVAAGSSHSLAVCADGTIAAWGDNAYGQLGDNSSTSNWVPVAVDLSGVLAGKTVVAVAAGTFHSLALCAEGTIAAWGDNASGQLGNNSRITNLAPIAVDLSGVLAGKTVVAVAAGSTHSLARCADGTVAAWGSNTDGQLGNNSSANSLVPVSPAPLTPGGRFSGISIGSTGNYHSLALVALPPRPVLLNLSLSMGTLMPTFSSAIEDYTVNLPAGTDSVSVVPTSLNTMDAIRVNGGMAASGNSSDNLTLGYGSNLLNVTVTSPDGTLTRTYRVNIIRDVPDVVNATFTGPDDVPLSSSGLTGTNHSVSLALNFAPPAGTNLTIINNTGPGVINGTFSNLTRGEVVTLTHAGIPYKFLANYSGGTGNDLVLQWAAVRVVAWGSNESGQIGDNSNLSRWGPANVFSTGVLAGKTVMAVAAGASHSLALASDGTLAAWGGNGNGELGNNSNAANHPIPVAVSMNGVLAGKTVVSIAAGSAISLALCSDGTLATWGFGIGGFGINRRVPDAVDQHGILEGKKIVAATTSRDNLILALCSDGTIASWNLTNSRLPVLVNTSGILAGKTVVALAAGREHSLALCSDGTVAAWGGNDYGQLGNNSSTSYSTVPVAVNKTGILLGRTITAVSTGGSHSLALCSDGALVGWGLNNYGQLGNNSSTNSAVPVLVNKKNFPAGNSVMALQGASGRSLVLLSDGTLAAWGWNVDGRLGNNSTLNSPIPISVASTALTLNERFVGISSGSVAGHTVALIATPPIELGDPDRDGMPGFMETYLGTDPTLPDSKPWGIAQSTGVASLVWPESAPAGITVEPQWSPDLITWLASGETHNDIPARTLTVTSGAGKLRQAALETIGLPRIYLRLKLTRQ